MLVVSAYLPTTILDSALICRLGVVAVHRLTAVLAHSLPSLQTTLKESRHVSLKTLCRSIAGGHSLLTCAGLCCAATANLFAQVLRCTHNVHRLVQAFRCAPQSIELRRSFALRPQSIDLRRSFAVRHSGRHSMPIVAQCISNTRSQNGS